MAAAFLGIIVGFKSAGQLFRRWIRRLMTFFVSQGLVQLINLATGFLLLRWLSVTDYAVYSLVVGFQGTIGVLVELGLGSSIVALAAGRTDKEVIGGYVRATRHYRNRFFYMLVPVIVIAFPMLTLRQHWSLGLTGILLPAILSALYFQSWAAYYAVPLLIHQELKVYFRTPTFLGAARLGSNFLLYWLAALTASTAVWTSSISTILQGWFYKRHSAKYISEPIVSEPGKNREVLNYIKPLIPGVVFFALQGQISILMISWFGQSHSIAEVGALGRIGQVFVMLGAFNQVIIAPTIARLPRQLLARRYCQVLAGAVSVSLALIALGFAFPDLLLWLLGSKYSHLRTEVGFMMISTCLSYLTGVMWTMHAARKWVFAWASWGYIIAVLLTQIFGIAFMNLTTALNVIQFAILTAVATLCVQIICAFYGFLRCER